jgi:hypothetical protein
VVYKKDVTQGATQTPPYTYGVIGGQAHLQSVEIPGVPGLIHHSVDYRTDLTGQILSRESGIGGGRPMEVFYRFGGKQMGHVSNDGTRKTAYDVSIADRTAVQGTGLFHNGATVGTSHAGSWRGAIQPPRTTPALLRAVTPCRQTRRWAREEPLRAAREATRFAQDLE